MEKVVLLMHCCVFQISSIQLYPVSCKTLRFFAISAIDVDHMNMYPAGAIVNFQRSWGSSVPATILAPSERGADYRTIMHEHCGSFRPRHHLGQGLMVHSKVIPYKY